LDIPNLRCIFNKGGTNSDGQVYITFSRAGGGGGHAHVLIGYTFVDFGDGLVFDALDPDPSIKQTRTTLGTYFSKFPALVGFRQR
jgi:hypothetical protein